MTDLPRLEALVDRSQGIAVPLSPALRAAYAGDLRFPAAGGPYVFANFVSTLDGLVSFGMPDFASARHISRGHAGDRKSVV